MIDHDELSRMAGLGSPLSGARVEELRGFVELVLKWNPSINIIGKSTAEQIWVRHVLDSAQLLKFAQPHHRLWLDIGSGGGFPGIVIAILARDLFPNLHMALVESDQRKAVFLSEAARLFNLDVTVHRQRIEALEPQSADVVSARALAPLVDLCGFAERHLKAGGICVFPKGVSLEDEIEKARKKWSFDVDRTPSMTDSKAAMLCLRNLRRV